jgi:hypothetical protein
MELDLVSDADSFENASWAERRRVAEAAARRMGNEWSAEPNEDPLAGLGLRHASSGLSFVLVPGGSYEMGLTDRDLMEAEESCGKVRLDDEFLGHLSWFAREKGRCLPAHRVRVLPFVVTRRLVSKDDVERLTGAPWGTYGLGATATRRFHRDLAGRFQLRLPSEAEIEWIARDGGRFAFILDVVRRFHATDGYSSRLTSRFGLVGHEAEESTRSRDPWLIAASHFVGPFFAS